MVDKNGNSNCLQDMECPRCNESDYLEIVLPCRMALEDQGTDMAVPLTPWPDHYHVRCPSCQYNGDVDTFRIREEVESIGIEHNYVLTGLGEPNRPLRVRQSDDNVLTVEFDRDGEQQGRINVFLSDGELHINSSRVPLGVIASESDFA